MKKEIELEPTKRTFNDSELRQLPKRQVNNISKPLEFKIEETFVESKFYVITFFYEDGTTDSITLGISYPKGLELNRHYSIADIYGYAVVDDRKGL